MSLANWKKIDIETHGSQVRSLIQSGSVEGAFVNQTGTCLEGEFYDELEITCTLSLGKNGFYSFCSKCGDDLCPHGAALVSCYIEDQDSFEVLEFMKVPEKWSGKLNSYKKKRGAALSKSKSYKKRFLKMLDGLDLADSLLEEFLLITQSGSVVITSFKQRVERLDEFFLSGLKYKFLKLINSVAISGAGNTLLEELDRVFRLIKDSRVELKGCLDGDCSVLPYSEAATARGHIWKAGELEKCHGLKEAKLIQLSFVTIENLLAERVEEHGVWLDLLSGNTYVTKNYRPFKAMRFIEEANSDFLIHHSTSLVIYPGSRSQRVRWQESSVETLAAEHISLAFSQTSSFDQSEQKSLRKTLMESYDGQGIYGFYKVDSFLVDSGATVALMDGESYLLKDTFESQFLRTLNGAELCESACLFKFEYKEGAVQILPLCVVTNDKIVRLGF